MAAGDRTRSGHSRGGRAVEAALAAAAALAMAWGGAGPALADLAVADTGWDLYEVSFDPTALVDERSLTPIVRAVLTRPGLQANPERSPDGSTIAYESPARVGGRSTTQIVVLGPDGVERTLTKAPGGAEDPSWSPDGTSLAFASRGGLYTVDVESGRIRRLTRAPGADSAPDWSPDGRWVVFQRGVGDGAEIWIIRTATGQERALTRSEPSPKACRGQAGRDPDRYSRLPVCQFGSRDPVFSPDGSRILFVRDEDKAGADGGVLELQDSDLWVMRANGSRQRRLVPGEEKPVRFAPMTPDGHVQVSPTWSPDGRFVATMISHRHDAIQVFDTETGDWHYISDPGSSVYDSDLSWSADWTILRMGALPSSAVMRVD